jgi:hypothetical protein
MSVSIQDQNTLASPVTPLAFLKLVDLAEDIRDPGSFLGMLEWCEDVPFDVKIALAVHAITGITSFAATFAPEISKEQMTRNILLGNGFAEFIQISDTLPAVALGILNSGRRILGFDQERTALDSLPFVTIPVERVA